MILIVAIPSLDNIDRRALAGMQHYKKLAFPIGDGSRFKSVKIDFVYVTTPHHNQELIDKVLALHTPVTHYSPDGTARCSSCANRPVYPCETVRILTGE